MEDQWKNFGSGDNQEAVKNKGDDKNSRFELAASSASERIVKQPTIGNIEEYGRRARARSEQQRQNRKGIKLIKDSPLLVEQERQQPKHVFSPSNDNSAKKSQRQKRRNQTQQLLSSKTSRKTRQLVWTPDTSQIPRPPIDVQSTYIQLHGLPVGSTYETIRKFFIGLIPERVLVVLSNRIHISALDSFSYDDLASKNLQKLVYTNMDLRVLVKFDSVSAAGLAADRSGEIVPSKQVSNGVFEDSSRQDVEKSHRQARDYPRDGFSLGVTTLSKEIAYSLSKLSIDALAGVPLHDCLSDVESKLNPRVRQILWKNAGKTCQFAVDNEIKNSDLLIAADGREDKNTNDKNMDEMNLLTFDEYKLFSFYYNRLLRVQEDLMTSIQNENSDSNPVVSVDPVVRLTAHAFMVVENEMDRVDRLLYQYRASKFTCVK
jgi:hypothetical protein